MTYNDCKNKMRFGLSLLEISHALYLYSAVIAWTKG